MYVCFSFVYFFLFGFCKRQNRQQTCPSLCFSMLPLLVLNSPTSLSLSNFNALHFPLFFLIFKFMCWRFISSHLVLAFMPSCFYSKQDHEFHPRINILTQPSMNYRFNERKKNHTTIYSVLLHNCCWILLFILIPLCLIPFCLFIFTFVRAYTDVNYVVENTDNRSLKEVFKLFDLIHILTTDHNTVARITREVWLLHKFCFCLIYCLFICASNNNT